MGREITGILTDVGTNELEVVEFHVDGRPYAINVAKVREIIRPQPVMALPDSNPNVLGVFRNRDEVLPLVDLGRWLNATDEVDASKAKVIVTEFNSTRVGFLVHGVNRIHRVSWSDLEAPDRGSMLESRSTLGYLRLGGAEGERIVFMIDFEGIVASLQPESREPVLALPDVMSARRQTKVILVAEDSHLIRKMLQQTLEGGGFQVAVTTNGEEAWERLQAGPPVDLIISDIEMPRMDGHHLTKKVKEDARLQKTPVVLYSSMINEENRRKGEAVGADAQLCKPELQKLVEVADGLLGL